MTYVAGVDGGSTKTRCIIGDTKGNILGDYVGGPSNHQTSSKEEAEAVLKNVYENALSISGLKKENIKFIYFGLSGADMPSDFKALNQICSNIVDSTPFETVNDAWISMRSGLDGTWGAVSICGTGANAGACHMDGRRVILSALSYELGNYGGGGHITKKALHHAFRAFEGTGPETELIKYLPDLLGAADMEDLLSKFYPEKLVSPEMMLKVPPLVFSLASRRDGICQNILIKIGKVMGEMTAGVIKRLGMEDMAVPVVLGGSIYKGNNPLVIDAFTTALHREVPEAYLKMPKLPPVAGAYLSALDSIGIKCGDEVYSNLEKCFKEKAQKGIEIKSTIV